MRQLSFGSPGPSDQGFRRWVEDSLRTIEQQSNEDMEAVLSEFTTTGSFTETRTFDASTATLADLRNFVATMFSDIKKGGQKRGYPT
jgi:transcriptional regulator of heat shock response